MSLTAVSFLSVVLLCLLCVFVSLKPLGAIWRGRKRKGKERKVKKRRNGFFFKKNSQIQ